MTPPAATPGGLPRAFDAMAAAAGLLLLSPLFVAIALLVAATSRGGMLFRQERVGRGGGLFTLHKFRTMRPTETGPRVTAGGDPRITAVGRLLRRTKLDELPELWNVLVGEMSFVGPRPEVPEYVEASDPLWRRVLSVRPGLTDPMTLATRNEEELLAGVEGNRLRFYRETLLPFKLRGYAHYLERRTAWSDLAVIARTLAVIVRPSLANPPSLEEIVAANEKGRS